MSTKQNDITYNSAKVWQMILFPLNNTATNTYMYLMFFVSYLAVGGLGLGVAMVGVIVTFSRLFDAITDPIIGYVIDKTKTKIGKFRPMIILGYTIMTAILAFMFLVLPKFSNYYVKFILFIVSYVIYIIGYTFQTACTKSGQTCITNNPSQRPVFTRCDAIYNLSFFAFMAFYTANYLAKKYQGFTTAALSEFFITAAIIAGIFTFLAIVALWKKDVPANWGISNDAKVSLKDYIPILKKNRPLQMLVVAASTDKLSLNSANNSAILVMLFGIVMGNYSLSGQISLITMIPSILIILYGTQIAMKKGSKKALVDFTWYSIILAIIYFAFYIFFDYRSVSFAAINFTTVVFVILTCLFKGVQSISSNIVIPMIADCADYETYLSGKYVPGMIGTLFSFVDKVISSLSTTIVNGALAFIGYKAMMPQPTDTYSTSIFAFTMAIYLGLPILGWICSLIAMKYYELDGERMKEIQQEISNIKAKAN